MTWEERFKASLKVNRWPVSLVSSKDEAEQKRLDKLKRLYPPDTKWEKLSKDDSDLGTLKSTRVTLGKFISDPHGNRHL